MSRRGKRPIALCPGNARGRRKLKRYKAREKRKLFGKIRVADETRQGDGVSGRLQLKAFQDAEMDGAQKAIARKHGMSDGDIRTLRDLFFKAFPHLKALAKQYKEERR